MDPVCWSGEEAEQLSHEVHRIPDTEVLKRAGTQSLYSILRSQRLRWLGHAAPMNNSRIPKQILYGELSEGTRNVGPPTLPFKDQCRTSASKLACQQMKG